MQQQFNRSQLVRFGNYLLSDERKKGYKQSKSPVPLKDRLSSVNHADVENFLEAEKQKEGV